MKNMLRKLGVDDQVYYWFASGDQTTSFDHEIVFTEELNGTILTNAIKTAMMIHTAYRAQPVIEDGRVYASIDDIENVPVFYMDSKTRCFGTPETYGYLFYFSFQKNTLVLHQFHGLSDGLASFSFLGTVLKYYISELKGLQMEPPKSDSIDFIMATEHILKANVARPCAGRFVPEDHVGEVFHFSKDLFSEAERKWRQFEIEVPLAPFLDVAKSNGSSILTLLVAMIGNAIRSNFEVGDKMIVAYTPIDMRRIFDFSTGNNGSSFVSIPYRAMMDKYDLGERAKLLRRILEAQIQPCNVLKGLMEMQESYIQANSQCNSIEQVVAAIKWMKARKGYMAPHTYSLSYLGKIRFSEEVDSFVDSVKTTFAACSVPLMMVASEFNGVLRIVATQKFDYDEIIKSIFAEIAHVIPGCDFVDGGTHFFDRLDLVKLEHISNEIIEV